METSINIQNRSSSDQHEVEVDNNSQHVVGHGQTRDNDTTTDVAKFMWAAKMKNQNKKKAVVARPAKKRKAEKWVAPKRPQAGLPRPKINKKRRFPSDSEEWEDEEGDEGDGHMPASARPPTNNLPPKLCSQCFITGKIPYNS